MKKFLLLPALFFIVSCKTSVQTVTNEVSPYEAEILAKNAEHENPRMRYKLVESKVLDKTVIESAINDQLQDFSEADYERLYEMVYEQDIPSIRQHISNGMLTYKLLVQWYLHRIRKYEIDPKTTLHTIIAINPNAVAEATRLDGERSETVHPIHGMPILLKDNINASGMATTAGSIALLNNNPGDAFIVEKMKGAGAIVLGKVNLSEWAYFFCSGCPVGYSAVGGQTLNPYGRSVFESGGSSSGSGTSMAANYAVGAIGTETSGSILSPSSQNSIVGLKPTVGLLSRGGIVPISTTLDTPGPMTKNVTDNAILLSVLVGRDEKDHYTNVNDGEPEDYLLLGDVKLSEIKIGANKNYMDEIPLYAEVMLDLNRRGAEIYGFSPDEVQLDGFLSILNIDMKRDLPIYFKNYAGEGINYEGVEDIVKYNMKDMDVRAPYGQALFQGIIADETSEEELVKIIDSGRAKAQAYFSEPMQEFNLDVIASVNNYDAGRAALAHYPALTIPMGYQEDGEPMNITLISKSLSEASLLKIGYAIEQATQRRVPPVME